MTESFIKSMMKFLKNGGGDTCRCSCPSSHHFIVGVLFLKYVGPMYLVMYQGRDRSLNCYHVFPSHHCIVCTSEPELFVVLIQAKKIMIIMPVFVAI